MAANDDLRVDQLDPLTDPADDTALYAEANPDSVATRADRRLALSVLFGKPRAIGSDTPNSGAFTTLSADEVDFADLDAKMAAAGAILKADFDAQTILRAIVDNTPVALTIGEDTIVGRKAGGNVDALAAADVRAILNVEDGADVTDQTNVVAALINATLGGALTLAADPSSDMHPATKQYVDARAGGLDPKESVVAATTANITLSGEQTIDGIAVTDGDRVLVMAQSSGAENGIYVASTGSWSRAADADQDGEITNGTFVFVAGGTVNGTKGFIVTTTGDITIGTTPITFTSFSATPVGGVLRTDFDANTILRAVTDDNPVALTIAEDRIVGRKTGGSIDALTGDEVLAMATVVSQGDAETGTATDARVWTALRARQASDAAIAAAIDDTVQAHSAALDNVATDPITKTEADAAYDASGAAASAVSSHESAYDHSSYATVAQLNAAKNAAIGVALIF